MVNPTDDSLVLHVHPDTSHRYLCYRSESLLAYSSITSSTPVLDRHRYPATRQHLHPSAHNVHAARYEHRILLLIDDTVNSLSFTLFYHATLSGRKRPSVSSAKTESLRLRISQYSSNHVLHGIREYAGREQHSSCIHER